ncbi:MBG domain-containing protein [Porphyrobacter sp. CACIAM 03H1]|uniref:MBG domain-containing protein n=1 Tax=Porphyrobacter sp. CACIAM 03H1 TaxID=2003315 RepID=UPI000B5AAB6C|nr:MBG domain-containing protein [Porphyrobacter sp. CACIAM 03H1]ASJ90512.1 hypothetical protein CBR61_05930 [Porphyrobacter sp. CACIAM 03H1]
MSHAALKRSRLLVGCGSAALALGLLLGPAPAAAQGIQAEPAVVLGNAAIENTSPTDTVIEVRTPTVVIDWTPNEDQFGNALDFIRAGATATFINPQGPQMAVLNRILPSTNGNIAVIDGAVIGRITTAAGLTPGGTIAFYSPTGLLIGGTATFDVGSLMLTTLDATNTGFQNFAEQGANLTLTGAQGSTARISIAPGAQITATPENAFFAVVAADVEMRGIARINGSHAYVAGEVVNLSFSNGLFDISVPVGTAAAGEAVTLDGTVGGPSSTGNLNDNHMIYAVARAAADPISMLFRGNLGFDPAQAAGVVNGEIILSANYNVSGRTVNGGTIADGANARFAGNAALTNVRADINIEDFTASSRLLAIGTHSVRAAAIGAASSVAGNLQLVGREQALLTAENGFGLTVAGEVLVDARAYGQVGSVLLPNAIDAVAGIARIEALGGGTLTLNNRVFVTADAQAGANAVQLIAGRAQAGQALVGATGGTINIAGETTISARAFGTNVGGILTGAEARGGVAQLFASQGGQMTVGQNLLITAAALAAQSDLANPSTVSNSFGGNAAIRVFGGGGTINVGGTAQLDANAFAGAANATGGGALADAGEAGVSVDGAGTVVFASSLELSANAFGGNNGNGQGGQALGGASRLLVNGTGASVTVNGNFAATARAEAGNGTSGGDGFGGIAGANAVVGTIAINGTALANAEALGGAANFGFGGNGGLGRGGNAFFQADGTLAEAARVTITGAATAIANGTGGAGGAVNAALGTPAGRGGDGIGGQFTVPNQADPTRNSGAFILAGGDNGTIEVGGDAVATATGIGGRGGAGTSVIAGGLGGNGFGGLAQVGLALLGQNGSLGQGIARFANLRAEADGIGGSGGFALNDFPEGPGGNGTGGSALMTVRAGDITANQVELRAVGTGGDGVGAGSGTGGTASVLGSLGGTLTATGLNVLAGGVGGAAVLGGAGGNGIGGRAAIEGDGITVTINGNALIDATATGGAAELGAGGNGTGGQALVATVTPANGGAVTITGHAQVFANGDGGAANGGAFAGGTGTGGLAYLDALGGGTITLGSAQVHAVGRGGVSQIHKGGDGIGGTVRLNAGGTGSRLTIQNNVPGGFGNALGGLTVASANGLGAVTVGGDGIGGLGRGGTLDLIAAQGGTLTLPVGTPTSYFARGFGGNSSAQGGTGGAAFGGTAAMTVDGGTMVAGSATLSAFAQGGASADPARNITGGNATGGTRRIRVINAGTLSMEGNGGGAGAQGGNGSGTGNGGDALAGSVLMEVINATANLSGNFILFNQSAGGNGQRGGNASGGTIFLNATNAQINLAPGASGPGALTLSNAMQGGQGVVAGGDAAGGTVTATITGTQIGGGRLDFTQTATGGNAVAATGTGGNATGATLAATFTNSTLNLAGEVVFAADARGGVGGTAGTGGRATGGTSDINLVGTIANIVADQQGNPGILRVRAQANGGTAGQTGNATGGRALLGLNGATLTANVIDIDARALATTATPDQIAGAAAGGEALLNLAGLTQVTAGQLQVTGLAETSQAGSATGGRAVIEALTGSTATLTVGQITASADAITGANATGGIAGTTQGGQALVGASGGNLTITGTVQATARGVGVAASDVVTGAAARGGNAQLRAQQGGNVTLNGNLTLDASATGSRGSLTGASSVSDTFGGNAQMLVLAGGGSLTINGNATANASARGGSSNNAGAGSLADAGVAIANVEGAGTGTIDVTGLLTLSAQAQGGENAGGTGGVALGGRASTTTFAGGTIRLGRLSAETLATGGNGRTGGNAFGGIAGANAIIGEIAINGRAFAGTEGVGGDATYGVGGTGGNGRGGNSFFQADGSLTQTARLSVTGDAIAFAQGVGGRGGAGDAVTAGGRGGDGFGGGQGNIPNQADPAFGSGAFILAGGDNGTIIIGGQAVAVGTAAGGNGGAGGTGTAGGRGGDAFGGLAQAGLALLGGTGAVGLGSAQFDRMLVQSDAFGGNGGIGGSPALRGIGGNAVAGTSALTVRAGRVSASGRAEIIANGSGGNGITGGNGTGGSAGIFGSLGGRLTMAQVDVIANGTGAQSEGTGNGGIGRGGEASINFSSLDTAFSQDVLVEANGTGGRSGTSAASVGGNGIGGTARIGTLGTATGSGSITGNTRVFANGTGGAVLNGVAGTGGNGTGGLAEAIARNGGLSRFGSLQVSAGGQGGQGTLGEYVGGNGFGGAASLLASGAGSQLVVLRNTPGSAATVLNEGAILGAMGRGGNTTGGNGIGGNGTGGTILVTAQSGGSIALPAQPFNDPGTIGFNRLFARGYGGGSSVEGGAGGTGTGGNARLVVDGGTLSMGETVLSAFGQGGSSLDPARNIAGGAGFGGERLVRAINGGVANLNLIGGVSGGQGGNGSGTGNGGNATGGTGLVEVINATLNVTGELAVVDQSTGGTGQRGGNAVGNGPNGGLRFIATGATINITPNANGVGGIFMGGVTAGGEGIVAGGSASGPGVTLTLANTQINGGTIRVEPLAQGGAATAATGIGGAASAGLVNVSITASNLALAGESVIQSDATGGAGGATGEGGAASAGTADVIVTNTTLAIAAAGAGRPGILRVQSRATGGLAGRVGNAASGLAVLSLNGTTLTAEQVLVAASAAAGGATGQTGGAATGGQALLALAGGGTVNAPQIEIAANGQTAAGGTTRGGTASLTLATGSTATVNAVQLRLLANATGGNPGTAANGAGRFLVDVGGGSVNAGSLTASADGDALIGTPAASELAAQGGNLNVTGTLNAATFGNLLVRSGQGAVIGSAATAQSAPAIQLDARGTIEIRSDGSTAGGLGGQSITLLAGRSILLNGNLTTRDGPVTLTANRGGGQALTQPAASVITMAQGSRIAAGTGTVTMRLLDGAGDPQRTSGAIELAGISGSRIDVRNQGTSPGSDIRVLAGGVLTASGTGRAIDLASLGGEVVNLAGDAGLVLTGGGHYGIFAATPTGSQIGSFANYARRYNVATATAYDALNPGGNFAAFRFAPVLTVTANNAARVYGNANPAFTASFAGFMPGDGIANISGAPQLGTSATASSNVGTFAITAALGTLLSEQGYQFSFAPGVLTITPRPITVTANNLSRVYGNANPALTFTVGGAGLVNGDQLVGALVTTAGPTTGVGIVPITQGTLAASANYVLTFVAGQLTITPRPLTITAANQSKLFSRPDPALTFTIGGDGLVNGDQLTGALARDPGELLGRYVIRQGTLTGGANYAITFAPGELTINPPPTPPELVNPTVIDSLAAGSDPVTASEAEEEERFGMDFPEQPDAPLISEDPLLDDPVSSGGDASLYVGVGGPRPDGGER